MDGQREEDQGIFTSILFDADIDGSVLHVDDRSV